MVKSSHSIFIISPHALYRQGIRAILESTEATLVVGEADSINEAMPLMQELQPQVTLVDLHLPDGDGIALIEQARLLGSSSRFLLLAASATFEEMQRCLEAQVDGCCLKEALPEEFLFAITLLLRGRKFYDPLLIDFFLNETHTRSMNVLERLTPKEVEVLQKLGEGKSNRDIARLLDVTEYTVKKHVSQVLLKLRLPDRTQAALYANAVGIARYRLP